ncbi:MAG TPA: hypothetical protein VN086_02335 [Candidatus Paceibacterota bacterium]|nr:hypothetical protein [Candidatus Paceibacterota bacterium]
MNARDLFSDTEPTLYDVIDLMLKGFTRFDHIDGQFEGVRQELRDIKHRLFKLELQSEGVSDTVQNHEERLIGLGRWKKGVGRRGLAGA